MADGKPMSQLDLAEAIGVSLRPIGVWENPDLPTLPDGENAAKVETLLDVPLLTKGRYLLPPLELEAV